MNTYGYALQNPIIYTDPEGLEVDYQGHIVLNPLVRENLDRLDRAFPDSNIIVTGGDRYLDSQGNVRSATNDTVIDTTITSPHLYERGARAADIYIHDKTTKQIRDAVKKSTKFLPGDRVKYYPKSKHTHVVLPNSSTYNLPDKIREAFCRQNPGRPGCDQYECR